MAVVIYSGKKSDAVKQEGPECGVEKEFSTNPREEKRFVHSILSSAGGRRNFSFSLRSRARRLKNIPILVMDQTTATMAISLVVFMPGA